MFGVIEIADEKVISLRLFPDTKDAFALAIECATENGISRSHAQADLTTHCYAGEMGPDQYAVWCVKATSDSE